MAQNSPYSIGIDTGGTYTDAVVLDRAAHRVVSSAKALTTKGDLSIGVAEAMKAALARAGGKGSEIGLISVSTTLATNAVVEGHGSAAAAVLIGFDPSMTDRAGLAKSFPGMAVMRIAGGHNHAGEEEEPLDEAALAGQIAACGPAATAFAVAGAFAVRNPTHEHRARDLIVRLTGKPVTISTELSSALDAPRRALTSVLNARLVSRISQLVDSVRRAMDGLAISCPLMMVKGDGSLAIAEAAARHPIETVLSGPAASLVGAQWLSTLDDFVMSDIGGTTTDVGLLLGGRPLVAEQGAEIAGWRTMVRAVDVKTEGLGGDSEIRVGLNGELIVGPERAVPLSLLAARYPETLAMLDGDLADTEGGSMHGRFLLLPFGGERPTDVHGVSSREAELFREISERPKPLRKLAVSSVAQRAATGLRKRGLVQLAAFTPSDAAHVLGMQETWDRQAALLAAKLLLRHRAMKMPDDGDVETFCREVWSKVAALSCRAILRSCIGTAANTALAEAVCRGKPDLGLATVAVKPNHPIVAVGGPAKVFYPEVGKRLGCDVIFPEFCDVANAVGAATGVIAQTVTVNVEGDGSGVFRCYGPSGARQHTSATGAIEGAEAEAREAATNAARDLGAEGIAVEVKIARDYLPGAANDDGLLRAIVTAEAVGRPRFA
ncbi:MAG: hydantoinase/oxoprolinase N-terminal domain-containing protein [Aestuariivirga sp.]